MIILQYYVGFSRQVFIAIYECCNGVIPRIILNFPSMAFISEETKVWIICSCPSVAHC